MAQRKRPDFGPEVVERLAHAKARRDDAVSAATHVYEDALLDAFDAGMTYREINDTVAGSHTTLTQQIKNARARRSAEDPRSD
ncbi:hypothetical protein [Aeromicrobium sp. CF3.5]|uniref:hypothetical protein n=1 Tax=Aeromicrobium sp. CF3.5 TaxID=3373078 RepID=UPI003EE7F66E